MFGLGTYQFNFGPGFPMGGYDARKTPSEGVHDPIYARTVIIDDGTDKICLVTVDFVALEKKRVEKTKLRINKEFGILIDNIAISATHSHSAPLNVNLFAEPYEGFEEVYTGIFESVSEAMKNLKEGVIKIGTQIVSGAAFNRRDWDEKSNYIDEEATVLIFESNSGSMEGILYNYSNHPVVLEPTNLLISADWPHYTEKYLRESLSKPDLFVMFVNGTPGNTNPSNSPMTGSKPRNFDMCKDIGDITAKGILEIIPNVETLSISPIKGITKEIIIDADDVDKEEIFTFSDGFIENDVFKIKTVIQALRIGDLGIVTAPGEYFPHIARSIKEKSPFKYTFIMGYANDYIGYVGKKEHYEIGGYEMFMMSLNADEGQILEEASISLINSLN